MGLTAFCVLVQRDRRRDSSAPPIRGTHLAAGQPARTSADRSGARGKLTASQEYLCGEATHRIPNWRSSVIGPLPFPALRFSAGREPLSRLPFGAPKNGAVWTAAPSPLQEKSHGDGGMGARSLATVTFRRLPLVGHRRSSGGSAANKINLDIDRPSHRRRGGNPVMGRIS